MRVSDFGYDLPPELIAQRPADRRDASRLLVVPPAGSFEHRRFADLPELLGPGDVIVVNESRVFPARLRGRKPTGAEAEVLLVRPIQSGDPSEAAGQRHAHLPAWDASSRFWEALVRPGGKLKPGRTVIVSDELSIEIVDTLPSGNRVVRLEAEGPVEEVLERLGHIPLPPYIERPDDLEDRSRYQTVYARERGSIAAPTAGLHFTDDVLRRIEELGVLRAAITLHVGVGTFRPVEVEDPAEHPMHAEWYSIADSAAEAIEGARQSGGRVWAVGTTAVRTLESAVDERGRVRPGRGETDLFIRPPYDFRVVDGLITNFHLPRSTLLMLVAALAGHDRTMAAYAEAVAERYRFYSYGDAMAITPR
jgi:S-adenosylmethionine:tRNA ribosyltransferase-isomerase